MRRVVAILLAAALWLGGGAVRAAEILSADLSSHVVAITTGFTGASLVLFGSRQEPGEIVIVVRGPRGNAVVRRRHHVLGFWINTESAAFADVPAFYAVISNRPLAAIAPDAVLRSHGIGIQNLAPPLRRPRALSAKREQDYRAALTRREELDHRFVETTDGIAFVGEHLFRAPIRFPANVPIGAYSVEVFLLREGSIVAAHTVSLSVTEAGVDSNVSQFAADEALPYGLIAVATTAMAGWLASLPFRNR
jgi:uncharacterized protein (TIGR02186 family)